MALGLFPSVNFATPAAASLPPAPVVPRATLVSTATPPSEQQATLSGIGEVIPVIYGRQRVPALLANVVTYAGYTYIVAVWATGECDAIESVTHGEEALPAGVTRTDYLGTTGQSADADLIAAFAAQSPAIAYADALPGVCYSVIKASDGTPLQWQALAATIRGRKIYDPRTTLTVWSNNAALCLADYLADTDYGAARTVDYTTVGAVATAWDTDWDGDFGLALDKPRKPDDWIDTLRTYARAWVVLGDSGWRLVADAAASSVKLFDHGAGQIERIGPLKKRGLRDAPTTIDVRWTDTSALPWRERGLEIPATLPSWLGEARPSEVPLPGIRSATQARREAIYRLNRLTTADLSFALDVYDEALAIEVGDVVTVTYPAHGLSAKAMRVAAPPEQTSPGRWRLDLIEYDAAAYSSEVVTEPTSPDTTLQSPADPQPVSGLALVEEVFQLENGNYASRIRASWSADTQIRGGYRAELRAGGVVVGGGLVGANATTWASPAVQEGVLHTLDLWTIGVLGNESTPATQTLTPAGKALIPGDVPSITVREVGGEVRALAEAAVDIDIWRYEWRYVTTAGTWEDATLIDRLDSLRLVTSEVPTGTWDILCKAIDSIGQESANAARKSVTVTSDAGAFLVGDYDLTTAALSNMHAFTLTREDTKQRYVTVDGATAAAKFPSSPAASSYPNVASSYNAAASSITLPSASTGQDFGQELSGNWSAELTVTDIAGTSTSELGVSSDGSSWTDYSAMSAKTTGRYGRVKASASSGTVLLVEVPTANVRLDAVTRDENGSATSSAGAATTITLANSYSAAQSLVITPTGTAARTPVVDNISPGTTTTFDVYLFDSSGTQVASDFLWAWKGV